MGRGVATKTTTDDRQTDSRDPIEVDNQTSTLILNRLPNTAGIYLEGIVSGCPVHFTTDTGASTSILFNRVYQNIDDDQKPLLLGDFQLKGAGGSNIPVYGSGTFEIQFGKIKLEKPLLVADIEDDALLGIDILMSRDSKAEILLDKNIINLML